MVANLRSQCPQSVSQGQNLQSGNPGVHSPIFATGGVGNVARFSATPTFTVQTQISMSDSIIRTKPSSSELSHLASLQVWSLQL